MKKLIVWLLVIVVGIGAGLFITYLLLRSPQTSKVQVEKPSKQEQDVRNLHLLAEAGFIELATKVTYTQMTPSELGWLLEINIDSQIVKETDVLDMLLELLDELQRSKVEIAQASALVYSDALHDQLGRRIPNLPVARMQVSQPTLSDAEWQHVKHEDMPKVLDEFWVNPALEKEEKQQQ